MLCLVLAFSGAPAQEADELLVTSPRTDRTVIPGASLKRPADFALQRLRVSNDNRDERVRKEEILETLRQMAAAAARDKTLELALLADQRTVVPLKIDALALRFAQGNRVDTSEVIVCVKTKVLPGAGNAAALFAKLRGFPSTFKPVGRSAVDLLADVDLSVVNPPQYREQVIKLYAADSKLVTSALGQDYRVVTKGIDRQLQWVRDGLLDVLFFIPYEYDVIPANVTSYSTHEVAPVPGRPGNLQ
jgi:hypothetical protein